MPPERLSDEPGKIDYDREWARWGDMSEHAPTPVHLRRLILQEAEKLPFDNALDIGCGTGSLLSALRKHFPKRRLSGADISRIAVERARQQNPQVSFYVLDIQKENPPGSFDLVVMSEVIEHLQEPLAALRNIRRICFGYLILTTPTGPRLPTDLAFWHLQHFTPSELREILGAAGFEILRLYRWGWPFQVLFRRIINRIPRWSHAVFVRGGNYSFLKRVASVVWTSLFYLNQNGKGTQLILVAKISSPH